MAGSVYEGKTYDEAVRRGLEELRLTRAEAVITTIEEGRGGFLGIGARPFRVSVARRPGGAIREPSERAREPRAAGDDRRGRRGGREERGGARGGRRGSGERTREAPGAGRAGGEERSAGRGRGGRDRTAASGALGRRSIEETGSERPARVPSQGSASTRGGRGEPAAPSEERASGPRARRQGGEREGRREESAREPRVARESERKSAPEPRPDQPMAGAAGAMGAVEPGAEGDAASRKRRRRGRRGGRGRRRGGPEGAGEAQGFESAPAMNGVETFDVPGFDEARAPELETPADAPVHEPARAESLPPAEAPDAFSAPAPAWAPREPEVEPSLAARDTMPHQPVREARTDRAERHRPRPESAPDMNVDELSSTSRRLTEELLKAMGFEPRVSVRAEGNRVDVTVEVDRDDDLLNGRQGETRQAIQHLLNRFLNKGDGSRYHLQLEVNDHWQQRETELAELAHRLAEEAASRQAEVVSDYMNSQERRIVHMTLREDGRVKTYSLGAGAVKRVAVAPAGFPDRSEDDTAS